ncbi:MAG: translation initiation factor IF-2 subunit beta, partial [Candidatus Bathyarchaeota archaeon]
MRFDYNELLERARSQLPPDVSERKRFEVPKPRSITIGMKTFVQNFKEICDALNRDPQ